MKDFIKKYQKNKLIGNIGVVFAALIMAVGVNVFLIDGTDTGSNFKASVINSNKIVNNNNGDIYLSKKDSSIGIYSSNQMNNVENISFSLTYNPSEIGINGLDSDLGDIINISNEPGINSIIISLTESKSLKPNDLIGEIKYSKKGEEVTQMNILNANFKDSDSGKFLLTTSGINF